MKVLLCTSISKRALLSSLRLRRDYVHSARKRLRRMTQPNPQTFDSYGDDTHRPTQPYAVVVDTNSDESIVAHPQYLSVNRAVPQKLLHPTTSAIFYTVLGNIPISCVEQRWG